LACDLDSEEVSQGFSDNGATALQGVFGRVIVDGLQDLSFLGREYRADPHPVLVLGRHG
jgi:hypothetical protein